MFRGVIDSKVMRTIENISDLVSYWPTPTEFGENLAKFGPPCPRSRVYQWMNANRILGKYWEQVIAACDDRGVRFSIEDLERIHGKEKNAK